MSPVAPLSRASSPKVTAYEETRLRVKEAIEGYLESLLKDGEPV